MIIISGLKLRLNDLDNIVAEFNVNSRSRSISARWRGDVLHVIVPPGMTVERTVVQLIRMRNRIIAKRPVLRFYDGEHLEFDGFTVDFRRQSLYPDKLTLTGSTYAPVVSVGTNLDYNDLEVTKLASKLMCVAAKSIASGVLLPHAAGLAAGLGLKPARWKISSGHRTLGTCNSRGEISLSAVVLFLTPRLRDYIIYHELAHLDEMNHSPRFHELCNRYCGGYEKELIKELKGYRWPIMRL